MCWGEGGCTHLSLSQCPLQRSSSNLDVLLLPLTFGGSSFMRAEQNPRPDLMEQRRVSPHKSTGRVERRPLPCPVQHLSAWWPEEGRCEDSRRALMGKAGEAIPASAQHSPTRMLGPVSTGRSLSSPTAHISFHRQDSAHRGNTSDELTTLWRQRPRPPKP